MSPAPAPQPQHISSRDNPWLKQLRRLVRESGAYRAHGQIWLEGEHLCGAAVARGVLPRIAVFAASAWAQAPDPWRWAAPRQVVLPDALFADLSGLESPARMGFLIDWPQAPGCTPGLATVVLDRVQDAGNVGAILRSAAAFGFGQVLALKGTVALWAPKVLRAGMGAHFALRLIEGGDVPAVAGLQLPLLATSSHVGQWLHRARLPAPCAWVFGHEGQGVHATLMAQASQTIRIAQPGGEESLNVAAAAAICLHASATQHG